MSFPKGNLDGIQRHYSVHNLSREIPKEEIDDDEKKKISTRYSSHSFS